MKLYILSFLLFFGCLPQNSQTNKKKIQKEEVNTENKDAITLEIEEPEDYAGLREATGDSIEVLYMAAHKYYDFLYHPYDFDLEISKLKKILGEEATVSIQMVEANEYDEEYSIHTVSYTETKLVFYDFEGKHSATITTPLLPLINGIKVGMTQEDFIKTIKLEEKEAPKTNVYSIFDDYGAMDFSFRADTLYLIKGYYEEGD
ncbi:hypothetical protein [Flagellimonas sp. S3867]|uniref:hypothetical protein n=1 Tax=Flagellimonas sp. S3867 TaxID=2768063 RepID=UPI001687DF04|nr:hypothetical protein [Flagellimonas sp. S3867]